MKKELVLWKSSLYIFTLFSALTLASANPPQTTRNQKVPTQPATHTTSQTTPLQNGMMVLNVADIVEKVNKAVVNIQSAAEEGGASFGSGFFVDNNGLLVTNFHVIKDALKIGGEISVVTTNDERFTASIKGYDESTDLALLQIKLGENKVNFVSLGDSDRVRVGEWAIAVGSPYGLDHTVTLGIISAKGRSGLDGEYDDYMQTDAAINYGNSGGPLLNTKGEVIGINTLVLAKGQGLGFSIPVNILKEVLPQLRDQGRVRRSSLNIETADINFRMVKNLNLPPGVRGVLVSKVEKDTPAAKAGLRRDDIIISVNSTFVNSTGQFNRIISRLSPGSKVEIKIIRDDREFTVNAELIEKK